MSKDPGRKTDGIKDGGAVLVFTDGAASGNPGPGGWGAVLATGDGDVIELGAAEGSTTNNRMELLAVIEALHVLSHVDRPVVVCSDSSYVVNGITKWMPAWLRRGWMTTQNQQVLNKDLWRRLNALVKDREVTFKLLAGHRGVPGNERADRIAVAFAKGREPELYAGPESEYGIDLRSCPEPEQSGPRRKSRRSGKALAYLSLVDGQWMRHDTWGECEARVKGVSNARFQKVMCEEEICEVLRKWGVNAI